jgi:D-tyrosyl-tRNA(Tyr) deacylase
VTKTANLRIFSGDEGKMNYSVKDIGGEVLIVSQFTLYGRCEKGRRPDFLESAPPSSAIPLYEAFIERFKQEGLVVKNGVFGAHMEVELLNDGPVTLLLE